MRKLLLLPALIAVSFIAKAQKPTLPNITERGNSLVKRTLMPVQSPPVRFAATMPVFRPGQIENMPVSRPDPSQRYSLLVQEVIVANPLTAKPAP